MQTDRESKQFHLNMQILADGFEKHFSNMNFYRGSDKNILDGIHLLTERTTIDDRFVYIVIGNDVFSVLSECSEKAFIVFGDIPPLVQGRGNSILQFPKETDIWNVFNICQEIFQINKEWAESLHDIVLNDGSIEDLCVASYGYFHNPLFVHDGQMNIVACPIWVKGMVQWEKDERTGLNMISYDTINEFKMDKEYMETLQTHGANVFSADMRGHRDIYVNIWNTFGTYDGRLVICELENSLLPGQFAAAEYLASMIELLLKKKDSRNHTYGHALDEMFQSMINGGKEPELGARLAAIGWNIDDLYICIRINMEKRDYDVTSTGNVCSYIEGKISGSKAFYDDERICVIVNASVNRNYSSDIAYFLRDNLFKAGFSEVFHDISLLNVYYKQASIALKYCLQKNDTNWYRTFGSIALDYILDHCSPDFESSFICDAALIKLIEYDRANETEFYKTLKVYLLNERNTVKTSNELYIGRSTLFYRLRKIREITGLDSVHLSEPEKNLYLRISIFLLEKLNGRSI